MNILTILASISQILFFLKFERVRIPEDLQLVCNAAQRTTIAMVVVIVHSGKGLPPADFAILSKPTSDPYCVVNFGNQSYRTVTIDKDLSTDFGSYVNI